MRCADPRGTRLRWSARRARLGKGVYLARDDGNINVAETACRRSCLPSPALAALGVESHGSAPLILEVSKADQLDVNGAEDGREVRLRITTTAAFLQVAYDSLDDKEQILLAQAPDQPGQLKASRSCTGRYGPGFLKKLRVAWKQVLARSCWCAGCAMLLAVGTDD